MSKRKAVNGTVEEDATAEEMAEYAVLKAKLATIQQIIENGPRQIRSITDSVTDAQTLLPTAEKRFADYCEGYELVTISGKTFWKKEAK